MGKEIFKFYSLDHSDQILSDMNLSKTYSAQKNKWFGTSFKRFVNNKINLHSNYFKEALSGFNLTAWKQKIPSWFQKIALQFQYHYTKLWWYKKES